MTPPKPQVSAALAKYICLLSINWRAQGRSFEAILIEAERLIDAELKPLLDAAIAACRAHEIPQLESEVDKWRSR